MGFASSINGAVTFRDKLVRSGQWKAWKEEHNDIRWPKGRAQPKKAPSGTITLAEQETLLRDAPSSSTSAPMPAAKHQLGGEQHELLCFQTCTILNGITGETLTVNHETPIGDTWTLQAHIGRVLKTAPHNLKIVDENGSLVEPWHLINDMQHVSMWRYIVMNRREYEYVSNTPQEEENPG